jgi:hypothetical protein
VWADLFDDVTREVFAAGIVSLVGVGVAFIVARIPRARQWFLERRLGVPLVAAFLISGVMAGAMGLILRHETRKEVAFLKQSGFSLVAAGRVKAIGELYPDEQKGPAKFTVKKEGVGVYIVELKKTVSSDTPSPLPDIPIILVGPMRNEAGTSAKVLGTHTASFVVQTSQNDVKADANFWFLVFQAGSSP